jgi:PAS domain S-box-containing protein
MSAKPSVAPSDLQERLRFETLLADLSSKFVNLPPAELDREIEDAQRRVCECLDLDLSALWQWSVEDPNDLRMTHLYRPLGGPPVPETMDAQEFFPWCLQEVLAGRTIALSSLDEAPEAAAKDCEVWRHFGIKSVLTFPLAAGGGPVFGALGFNSQRDEHAWPDEIVQRLGLVAQIFANALERKRSDALLRESGERLHLAAESGEVGMWMLDVEGGRFWATPRAREIFGYGPDTDITVARFLESVHPENREPVEEALRRALEDGHEIDIEYRIERQDGSMSWVQSRGRMQPASATNPVRLLGASVDVTEGKQAEEELQRSYAEVQELRRELELENAYLQTQHRLKHGNGRIIGESPALMTVLEMVEQVAATGTTVLIEGETGTGKELIAQRIHELSPRSGRTLVKVNCAALPSTLVESELFGREKGAYTGAVSRESGRFEVANGSTLFLDEIAELPFELQSKLLRVLEEGQYERLGSSRTLKTDVRVIAATNRDLTAEVDAGRFRSDLFFRIAVFQIKAPPLRERRGDVPLLVWAVVRELSTGMNKAIETIRREDMERLQRYDWPGNVRELRNVVERAMILSNGPILRIALPGVTLSEENGDDAVLSLDEVQRRHILKALKTAAGRIRGSGGAAELLGVNSSTLRSRMKRLGIDPNELRGEISPP